MAFPRLNAFSYWTFLLSGLFVYSSFLVGQAPDGGWFAYVPLTTAPYSPGLNLDFYAIGLVFLTLSTTVGAINFIVTAVQAPRAGHVAGPAADLIWGTTTASFAALFSLPVAHRRLRHAVSRSPARNPLLRQHHGGTAAPVAAPVLDFRPSLGLHRRPAGHGHRVPGAARVLPPAAGRLRLRRAGRP